MRNVTIDSLINTLSKINDEFEKNTYHLESPLSVSNTFVKIIIGAIYDDNLHDKSLTEYPIVFISNQNNDIKDGEISIIVTKNTKEGKVLVESPKDSIHMLAKSALDLCIDIINKEYHYHIKRDDNDINRVIIEL